MEVLAKLAYYTWTIPLGWMVFDRNRMMARISKLETSHAETKAKTEGMQSDMSEVKGLLRAIANDVSETKQKVEYWRGRQDSQN